MSDRFITPHADVVGIVLAGGFGTRLRGLHPDCPKPLIPVGGRPFIDWVLDWFGDAGVAEFVVSLGYQAEVAQRHFAARDLAKPRVKTIVENEPLGTGGAIREAWRDCPNKSVLVLNGDSLLLADFTPVWNLWRTTDADAIVVGVYQQDASRFGTLRFDADGRLRSFEEKRPGQGVINAGIYLFRPTLRSDYPIETPLSVERDVFPRWLEHGRDIRVAVVDGPFIDIGLPESLASAEEFLRMHWPEGTRGS